MQEEENLVERAKRGDQQAFARLYEENFNRIYRYIVLRIGDRTEAEDLTQQVFLNAIRSIASFKWKGKPFITWLYRIAHNQVIDHLRKKNRESPAPLEESALGGDSSPELMAEHSLSIEEVLAATRGLTESQREVISLRFTSELSIAEVARIMGKSEGAVKALQHSAIAALRKALLVKDHEKD
ncbi:MAG: sigma-70 family RNA polymerase sigma factor [Chloroflexi bacterium]|nr:sigma-70 family RNA polymerase sigma factor [Chloroflexota bacterium]